MTAVGRGAVVRFVETGRAPEQSAPSAPAGVQTITDPASPLTLLASRYLGFRIEAVGDVELAAPDAGLPDQAIRVRFAAVGEDPALLTFDAGAWAFGSTLRRTAITATAPGTADWFGASFDAPSGLWVVLAYARGYAA